MAQLAVRNAFPGGGQGVDAASATAVSAPFLLDPAASILATGRVPGGVTNVCIRLVAGFLVGLAARVCGGAAVPLAEAALRRLRLPESCGVASLLVPCRSPAQDADSAGCALVDGDCVCDLSAPRGAEADARGGYGVMSDLV